MKRTFVSALLALLVLSGIADAQTPLRQSTSRVVRICGAVAVGDGFTPVTTLSLGAADEAEALRDNTATLDISGATFAAVTGADGCYSLTLDTTATNTVGELVVVIQDDSLILPIRRTFQVVEEAVYDRDFAASATGNSARVALALPNAAPDAAGGLPISDAGGLDLDALNTNINDIETDTADMQPKLGTFPNLGTGATLAANLEDMRDNGTAAFDRSTDSLQAIRDRGDAAWVTGAGGTGMTALANGTARAGGTSTQILIATAETFADNELRYNQICIDSGTGAGQCRFIESNTATGDIVVVSAPWTTNPDATSNYEVWPASSNVTAWAGDIAGVEAGLQDADDIWTASSRTLTAATNITSTGGTTVPQTGDSFSRIGANGAGLSAQPWNASWDAEVQSEATDALNAYDPPTRSELTTDINSLNDPTANEIRDAVMQYTLDNGITFEEAACHMLAVLLGEAAFTAGSPDQAVFSDPTGTDTRVTIQYGSDNGDRTAVTLSATNCGSN